jgi:hypothetical protein
VIKIGVKCKIYINREKINILLYSSYFKLNSTSAPCAAKDAAILSQYGVM